MTQITVAKQSPPKKRAKPLPVSETAPEPAVLPEPPALKPLPQPIPTSEPQPHQTAPPALLPLPTLSPASQTQQPTTPALQPIPHLIPSSQPHPKPAFMQPHTKSVPTQTIPQPKPLSRPLSSLVPKPEAYHRRAFEAPPKTQTKAFKPRPSNRPEATTRSSTPRPPPLLPVIRFPPLPTMPQPVPRSGPPSKWAKQAAKKKEKRRLEAEQADINGCIGLEQTAHLKKRSGKEAKRGVNKQAISLSVATHAAKVEKILGDLYTTMSSSVIDWGIKLKINPVRDLSHQELIGAQKSMEAAVRLEAYSKNSQLPSDEITESAKERIKKAFYN